MRGAESSVACPSPQLLIQTDEEDSSAWSRNSVARFRYRAKGAHGPLPIQLGALPPVSLLSGLIRRKRGENECVISAGESNPSGTLAERVSLGWREP